MTPVTSIHKIIPSEAGGCEASSAEAITLIDSPELTKIIADNELLYQMRRFGARTYEYPYKAYFLVFKPFDKAYEKDYNWFDKKSIDAVRRTLNCKDIFITREILETKIHINVLCYDTRDLTKQYHDRNRLNKFRVSCYELKTPTEREKVLHYITKEHKVRAFEKYKDYTITMSKGNPT